MEKLPVVSEDQSSAGDWANAVIGARYNDET